MNCEFENSFLLVYLSGPLIITHGPRGAAPADPPLSGPECLSCHAKSLCDYNSEWDFLRWSKFVQIFFVLFILNCIVVGDPIIRDKDCDPNNRFDPTTFLRLFQNNIYNMQAHNDTT
jgi:hypothetical protein